MHNVTEFWEQKEVELGDGNGGRIKEQQFSGGEQAVHEDPAVLQELDGERKADRMIFQLTMKE